MMEWKFGLFVICMGAVLPAVPAHAVERTQNWPAWQRARAALDRHWMRDEFRIHYTLSGVNALSAADQVDSDHDGLPDKIQNIGLQLLTARRCYVEVLGLRPPLESPRYKGRVKFIDVNVWSLGGKNGSAGDAIVNYHRPGDPPEGVEVVTMDLDVHLAAYNLSPAHELFHVFQNSYSQFKNAWYAEGTARWSEALFRKGMAASGPLPANRADVEGLFKLSYDASRFWQALSLAGADSIHVPEELRGIQYIGSSKPVMEKDAAQGAKWIKALFEALEHESDTVSKSEGIDPYNWAEARQHAPENNRRIWEAVIKACKSFTSPPIPLQSMVDALGPEPAKVSTESIQSKNQ